MLTSLPPESYLIAESGGSKTDWRWVRPEGIEAWRGPGLNPSHGQDLAQALAENLGERRAALHGVPLALYGAGLEARSARLALAAALRRQLGPAPLLLGTDLLAAARCADGPTLVALLGTGSNAARSDGTHIAAQRGGHGWILADAGSGVDLGRRLLLHLLQGDASAELQRAFAAATGGTPLDYRARMYAAPQPPQLLSALMPLIAQYHHLPEVATVIQSGFTAFLTQDLLPLCMPTCTRLITVGGVALALWDSWHTCCLQHDLPPPEAVAAVADRLVAYHARHGWDALGLEASADEL